MTVEEIYHEVGALKAKSTWFFGKTVTAKRALSVLEFRFNKAKSFEKTFWQAKINRKLDEIKRAEDELKLSLIILKQFLDESNIDKPDEQNYNGDRD